MSEAPKGRKETHRIRSLQGRPRSKGALAARFRARSSPMPAFRCLPSVGGVSSGASLRTGGLHGAGQEASGEAGRRCRAHALARAASARAATAAEGRPSGGVSTTLKGTWQLAGPSGQRGAPSPKSACAGPLSTFQSEVVITVKSPPGDSLGPLGAAATRRLGRGVRTLCNPSM